MAEVALELSASQRFPAGTVVGLYRAATFPGPPPQPGQAAVGAAAFTATVGEDGRVVIAGLPPDTAYFVGGQVGGVWRWMRSRTPAADEDAEQARAEAVEQELRTALEAIP